MKMNGIPEGRYCIGCDFFEIIKLDKALKKATPEKILTIEHKAKCLKFENVEKYIASENFELIKSRIKKYSECMNETNNKKK